MRGYPGTTMTTPEEFWARVPHKPADGCWIWPTQPESSAYSSVTWQGRIYPVHRLAYLLSGRLLFPGMEIHHKCEDPGCYRPDHLIALTKSEHQRQHPRWYHWRFALRRPATATTPEHCIVSREFTKKGPAALAGRTLQKAYPGYRLEVYRTDAKGKRLKVRDLPPAA